VTKTVLVTGASRGIGLALVERLRAAGHVVLAACRDPQASTSLAELAVPVVALDVADPSSVAMLAEAVARHTAHIDVLVNNAGIKQAPDFAWPASAGPMANVDATAVAAVLATNVVGPLIVTQALLPLLAQPGGVVANVSSRLGSLADGVGIDYAYNASKAALNMITVTMDRDLGPLGISAVAINPGWIRTSMGGSEAPLHLDEASHDLAALVVRLDQADAGRFIDRHGASMPW
jgi:NAD(P)-dependent dehydrogenase (short-subunit alcohol dehydrogenase family)